MSEFRKEKSGFKRTKDSVIRKESRKESIINVEEGRNITNLSPDGCCAH
jgi:hypothetical protein